MSHSVFTVVAVVKKGSLELLQPVLDRINAAPPFRRIEGVHFASFTIFTCPPLLQGQPEFEDPILVFENNIDGAGKRSQQKYVAALLATGSDVDDIYEHCQGWPGRAASPDEKAHYLLDRVRQPQLYHVGTPHRTTRGIRIDLRLRERLNVRLDKVTAGLLPAQLSTPPAGIGERWIWERLKQRLLWAALGMLSGLLVRGMWPYEIPLSLPQRLQGLLPLVDRVHGLLLRIPRPSLVAVLVAHWPGLAVLLILTAVIGLAAMADFVVFDPERLRLRQWLPIVIGAFALGITVQSLWADHRPLAVALLVAPLPVCCWLATRADMQHNRIERLESLGLDAELVQPASALRHLRRIIDAERDGSRLLRKRINVAVVGLATGLSIRLLWPYPRESVSLGFAPHWVSALLSYPHVPSLLLSGVFGISAVVLATVAPWSDKRDSLTPKQWMPWAIAGLGLGIVAPSIWYAYRWPGVILMVAVALSVLLWARRTDPSRSSVRRRGPMRPVRSGGVAAAAAGPVVPPATPWRRDRRPPLWRIFWNWRWWVIVWLGIWGVICFVTTRELVKGHLARQAAFIALLFLLKAWWLAVLAGWTPLKPRWAGKIFVFLIFALCAGFVGAYVLLFFEWSPPWLAIAVMAGLLSLWAMPLPSPSAHPAPLSGVELERLRAQEDWRVQNHMSAMVVLRQGALRAPLLKLFLRVLNTMFFRALLPDVYRGKLFGLPTVHFCQWVVLDSRRYLFLSNYDHSWTRYLDDFGLQLTTGIQKIWGQGEDNPGTSNLEAFKDFARTSMVPYAAWYSAYPGLSVIQIWNNEKIRRDLARTGDEQKAVALLRRFGAGPRIQNAFSK